MIMLKMGTLDELEEWEGKGGLEEGVLAEIKALMGVGITQKPSPEMIAEAERTLNDPKEPAHRKERAQKILNQAGK